VIVERKWRHGFCGFLLICVFSALPLAAQVRSQSKLLEPVFTAVAFQTGSSTGNLNQEGEGDIPLDVDTVGTDSEGGETFTETSASGVGNNGRASVIIRDKPSVCFNLEVTNVTGSNQETTLVVNAPIQPINTGGSLAQGGFDMFSVLDVVLTDGGPAGATMTGGLFGPAAPVLSPTLASTFTVGLTTLPSIELGTPPIVLPGTMEAAGPAGGPFLPAGESWTGIFLFVSFTLSPGDTANVTGIVDLDIGSAVSTCGIPPLPARVPGGPGPPGGPPPPDQIPTLSHWGMILLTLLLLLLATRQLGGQPTRLATGPAIQALSSPPDRRRLLRSILLGQGVAALGLALYGILAGSPTPLDGLGAFIAGLMMGWIIEFYRRGRELDPP
jgi:hypothetical protein